MLPQQDPMESEDQVTLPKWTAVEEIAMANAIPILLVSRTREDVSVRGEASALQGQSDTSKELWEKVIQ